MRFRIALRHIDPVIWRLIEVPDTYSFWDLHVAIQDSMGWLDYHLHQFNMRQGRSRATITIGIPDEFLDDTIPGWEASLSEWFKAVGDMAVYEYDFGDGWEHEVQLTGIALPEPGQKYPRCIDGGRACPPEDCGGPPGYADLQETLSDPSSEEYSSMAGWLEYHARNYWPYDPEKFDPAGVKFDNPKTRFKRAFSEP